MNKSKIFLLLTAGIFSISFNTQAAQQPNNNPIEKENPHDARMKRDLAFGETEDAVQATIDKFDKSEFEGLEQKIENGDALSEAELEAYSSLSQQDMQVNMLKQAVHQHVVQQTLNDIPEMIRFVKAGSLWLSKQEKKFDYTCFENLRQKKESGQPLEAAEERRYAELSNWKERMDSTSNLIDIRNQLLDASSRLAKRINGTKGDDGSDEDESSDEMSNEDQNS